MARVGFSTHPAFLAHDPGGGHPESRQRLEAIVTHLQRTDVWPKLHPLTPPLATRDILQLVHPPAYLDQLERACRSGPTALDPDTIVSPGTWEAACRATGAVTQAISEIFAGRLDAAFCAVRPPGHHALAAQPMGFCVINHIAVGARYAQQRHGVERVLIVDWDAHHGNGTQAIFAEDPRVLYFSTHQSPFYPGTGHGSDVGVGPGHGTTLHVPLPPGSGDAQLRHAFETQLVPAAEAFRPQLVLISAGFDAHRDDPLAQLEATEAGYATLTQIVRGIALQHASGRLVSMLEGGYHLTALARSVEAHLRASL